MAKPMPRFAEISMSMIATARRPATAIAVGLAGALLFAGAADAGTWRLGNRLNAFCRSGANVNGYNYCHNCRRALGANSYVTWTFQLTCDGHPTRYQVRGELVCQNPASEPAQRQAITQNALTKLPKSTQACPQ